MGRTAWAGLPWLIAVVCPWLIARIGRRPNLAALTAIASILIASAHVISDPSADRFSIAILIGGLLILDLGLWFAPARLERILVAMARRRRAKVLLSCLAATLIPLALAECVCRALTELRVLKYHKPIETVWRSGHDDWRLATITGDESREPDPVLLWRPVPRPPFTSQRFKGPLAEVPKPANVVRVMCYGDSLTDGPPRGGWPGSLQRLLAAQPHQPGLRFEVLNAGVAGYSSHQGMRRFLQEVDQFTPNLVLVSFGWNDAADASGQPDKSFRIPPWPLVACQRALVRYRSYLVLMYYTQGWRARPPVASPGPVEHRVSVDDYLANMERFRLECHARGIPIAFLTRPHRCPPAEMSKNPTWRRSVPEYNDALVKWASRNGALVLDVQRIFEQLPATLFADECHFTPQGYERMSRLVHQRLLDMPAGPLRLAGSAAVAQTDTRPFVDRQGIDSTQDPRVLRR
jgi:lysophospholipase L1-like esterase